MFSQKNKKNSYVYSYTYKLLNIRPFWVFTTVSFFKNTFSPLLACVLKILSILQKKIKILSHSIVQVKESHFCILCLVVNSCFSDPLSLVRDHRAKEVLTAQGIAVRSFNADLLYEPWDVNDAHGRPFTTFAAFWERCLSMPYDPESPLLPPMRIVSGLYSINYVPKLSSLYPFVYSSLSIF